MREYSNESDNESNISKTVLSDADTVNTHKTHESRDSGTADVVRLNDPIPSPAPTNTASLTGGRGNTPSLNEGITPMTGVPNNLYGDSDDEENSFNVMEPIGPIHFARQRSGGVHFHKHNLSMISVNSSASKHAGQGGGGHQKSNTLMTLSPRKGLMIKDIERTNKFSSNCSMFYVCGMTDCIMDFFYFVVIFCLFFCFFVFLSCCVKNTL